MATSTPTSKPLTHPPTYCEICGHGSQSSPTSAGAQPFPWVKQVIHSEAPLDILKQKRLGCVFEGKATEVFRLTRKNGLFQKYKLFWQSFLVSSPIFGNFISFPFPFLGPGPSCWQRACHDFPAPLEPSWGSADNRKTAPGHRPQSSHQKTDFQPEWRLKPLIKKCSFHSPFCQTSFPKPSSIAPRSLHRTSLALQVASHNAARTSWRLRLWHSPRAAGCRRYDAPRASQSHTPRSSRRPPYLVHRWK